MKTMIFKKYIIFCLITIFACLNICLDSSSAGSSKKQYKLFKAIANSDTKKIKKIIDKGINLNKPVKDETNGYITPLMVSVHFKNVDVSKLFLDNGASKWFVYKDDITVYDLAINSDDEKLKELFLTHSMSSIDDITDDIVWVNYMYNTIQEGHWEYFGYIDIINRSIRNQLTNNNTNEAFKIAKKFRSLWEGIEDQNQVIDSDNIFWKSITNEQGSDLYIALTKLNQRIGGINASTGIDFPFFYYDLNGYKPFVDIFKRGSGWLDWTEGHVNSLLLEFRQYAKNDPQFLQNAEDFIKPLTSIRPVDDRNMILKDSNSEFVEQINEYVNSLQGIYDSTTDDSERQRLINEVTIKITNELNKKLGKLTEQITSEIQQRTPPNRADFERRQKQIREMTSFYVIASNLVSLKDPDLARRIGTIGEGLGQLVAAASYTNQNGIDLTSISGYTKAFFMIYQSFQKRPPNGFKVLFDVINNMEERILKSFYSVNVKLDLIMDNLRQLHRDMYQYMSEVRVDILVVQNELIEITKKMYQMEFSLNRYFGDIKNRHKFNVITNTVGLNTFVRRHNLKESDFKNGINDLIGLCLASGDDVAQGSPIDLSDLTTFKERLQKNPIEKNLRLLASYSTRFDRAMNIKVANPVDWAQSSLFFIQFLQDWPEYQSEVRTNALKSIIKIGENIKTFVNKIDKTFVLEKFYTKNVYFGDKLSLLNNGIIDIGNKEETEINNFIKDKGKFISKSKFDKENFYPRYSKDYNNYDDYHITYSDWYIPLHINSFSTYIPDLVYDWPNLSRIYNASGTGGKIDQYNGNIYIPFFQRNYSIFTEIKYGNYRYDSMSGPAHGVILYRHIPPKPGGDVIIIPDEDPLNVIRGRSQGDGLIMKMEGSGYALKWSSPKVLFDLNYKNTRLPYSNSQKNIDDQNHNIQKVFLATIQKEIEISINDTISGSRPTLTMLRSLLDREQYMVHALRAYLLTAYNYNVTNSRELYEMLFSDSAFIIQNNLKGYSVHDNVHLKQRKQNILEQYNNIFQILKTELFSNDNVKGYLEIVETTLIKLRAVEELLSKNQRINISPYAAGRFITNFLDKEIGKTIFDQ